MLREIRGPALSLLLLVASLFPLGAMAADVFVEKSSLNIIGEIRRGDAERVADAIAQQPRPWIFRVIVNSPGGDINEAVRISDLVRGMRLAVYVANGGYCVSACFFIFLEGNYRAASLANEDGTLPPQAKRNNWPGVVGIHRPYLKSPAGDLASAKLQEDVMRKVRGILASKSIPQHLVDEMMTRPSNDIYWLKRRDLEQIGEYDAGDEEALIAKCGYKRTGTMVDDNWSEERVNKLLDCSLDYWIELYVPVQKIFNAKLRTGWRPWVKK